MKLTYKCPVLPTKKEMIEIYGLTYSPTLFYVLMKLKNG